MLLGICALIYFLDGLIHSILGPLAPDMARSLGLSNAELGPIFSANLVGQCIGLVVFPLLASRFGQRAIVVWCRGGLRTRAERFRARGRCTSCSSGVSSPACSSAAAFRAASRS